MRKVGTRPPSNLSREERGQERQVVVEIANAFEDGDGGLVGPPALRRKREKFAGGVEESLRVQSVNLLVLGQARAASGEYLARA